MVTTTAFLLPAVAAVVVVDGSGGGVGGREGGSRKSRERDKLGDAIPTVGRGGWRTRKEKESI